MIENSLAHLGKFLSEKMELPKERVAYADKELVFNKLSENNLPLTLPAVTYGNTNIEAYKLATRPYAGVANVNMNNTLAKLFEVIPIHMDIDIAIICNNIKEHFEYAKKYYRLAKESMFLTTVTLEVQNVEIETLINEITPLTVPPEGKEARDFDRGTYYVLEGAFKINSFFLYTKDHPIIREVNWEVTYDLYS